ncbi:MAG: hypothetical protein M1835_002807, partial [Candelina submexicana]
ETLGSEGEEASAASNQDPSVSNNSIKLDEADREPDAPFDVVRGAADETLGSEGEEASAASNQDPSVSNNSIKLDEADREPDAPFNVVRGAADETLGSEGEEGTAASNHDLSVSDNSMKLDEADREPDAPSNIVRGAADETPGSEGGEASDGTPSRSGNASSDMVEIRFHSESAGKKPSTPVTAAEDHPPHSSRFAGDNGNSKDDLTDNKVPPAINFIPTAHPQATVTPRLRIRPHNRTKRGKGGKKGASKGKEEGQAHDGDGSNQKDEAQGGGQIDRQGEIHGPDETQEGDKSQGVPKTQDDAKTFDDRTKDPVKVKPYRTNRGKHDKQAKWDAWQTRQATVPGSDRAGGEDEALQGGGGDATGGQIESREHGHDKASPSNARDAAAPTPSGFKFTSLVSDTVQAQATSPMPTTPTPTINASTPGSFNFGHSATPFGAKPVESNVKTFPNLFHAKTAAPPSSTVSQLPSILGVPLSLEPANPPGPPASHGLPRTFEFGKSSSVANAEVPRRNDNGWKSKFDAEIGLDAFSSAFRFQKGGSAEPISSLRSCNGPKSGTSAVGVVTNDAEDSRDQVPPASIFGSSAEKSSSFWEDNSFEGPIMPDGQATYPRPFRPQAGGIFARKGLEAEKLVILKKQMEKKVSEQASPSPIAKAKVQGWQKKKGGRKAAKREAEAKAKEAAKKAEKEKREAEERLKAEQKRSLQGDGTYEADNRGGKRHRGGEDKN